MHELSVAAGILDLVQRSVPASQADRVRVVRVRVGEMAGVVADSLDFCFTAIVAGTPFASASLAIERVPARGACRDCDCAFAVSDWRFLCPNWGGAAVAMTSGDELRVVEVELDDTARIAS